MQISVSPHGTPHMGAVSPGTPLRRSPRLRPVGTPRHGAVSPGTPLRRSPRLRPVGTPERHVRRALNLNYEPEAVNQMYDSDSDANDLSSNQDSDSDEDNYRNPHPMRNYDQDIENPTDYQNGWERPDFDTGCNVGPFLGLQCNLVGVDRKEPHHFFQALFNEEMFHIIAEKTNLYARKKLGK